MTTTSPEPSPYAVQLDADKHGIMPFADSNDPVTNYEHMHKFATWLLADPQSKASAPLRVDAAEFYRKLETSQASASDVPSYDEYLKLVDAYNVERGYTSLLRSHEPGSNAHVLTELAAIRALLEKNPPGSSRPRFMDRVRERAHEISANRPAPADPNHPAPSSQAQVGSPHPKH